MTKYGREENDKWLLRYLDERCEGADAGHGVSFDKRWWDKSESIEPEAESVVERMDFETLRATLSRLEERRFGNYEALGRALIRAWITDADRAFVKELKKPDLVAEHEDAARRHWALSRLIIAHEICGPFVGYIALVISLVNLIRACVQ
jgi:hypothetical protein